MREIVPQIAPDEVRSATRPETRPEVQPEAQPEIGPEKKTDPGTRKGPGPSKLTYRASRAWAKPIIRNATLVYMPLIALAIIGWRVAANDALRGMIETKVVTLVEQFAARPEFAVRGVTVVGGTSELHADVRLALGIQRGMSSLRFDVEELRHRELDSEEERILIYSRVFAAEKAIYYELFTRGHVRERAPEGSGRRRESSSGAGPAGRDVRACRGHGQVSRVSGAILLRVSPL